MFSSSPSVRSYSNSSASSGTSCSTTLSYPSSYSRTLPPKSDAASSMTFSEKPFEEGFFGLRERKAHNGQSIAPNLLSIKVEGAHQTSNPPLEPAFHQPQHIEDMLQQQQQQSFIAQNYEQSYPRIISYPEYAPQRYSSDSLSPSSSNGDYLYTTQNRMFDCSQPFASWGHETNSRGATAAIAALELSIPKVGMSSEEEDVDMTDRDSAGSSPTPAVRRKRRAPHPLVISSRDKPHVCSVGDCESRFKRPEHLRRHEKTHTGERPFPCAVCGRKFGRNDNLQTHMRTHMKMTGRNEYVPGLA